MPRDFFSAADGTTARDMAGPELPSPSAAQRAALGDPVRRRLDRRSTGPSRDDHAFHVCATDETGALLFTIEASATNAPDGGNTE